MHEFRNLGFPGAEDLDYVFHFNHDFEQLFCGARNVDLSRALNPRCRPFETWLAQNKTRIPLE